MKRIILLSLSLALLAACNSERDTKKKLSIIGPVFGTWEKLAIANGMETGKQPRSFDDIGFQPPRDAETAYIAFEDMEIGIRATLIQSLSGCGSGSYWEMMMLPDQTIRKSSSLKACDIELSSLSAFK